MKQKISITLDEDIIRAIENKRGLVSVSVFINEILKKWEKKENAKK